MGMVFRVCQPKSGTTDICVLILQITEVSVQSGVCDNHGWLARLIESAHRRPLATAKPGATATPIATATGDVCVAVTSQ